ncbi:hypothetical protein IWW38_005367, partial [Coemansia aciculifera]
MLKKGLHSLRSFVVRQRVPGSDLPSREQNVHLEANRVRQLMQRSPVRDIAIRASAQPYSEPRQCPEPRPNPAYIYWRMTGEIARLGRERDAHIATINHL